MKKQWKDSRFPNILWKSQISQKELGILAEPKTKTGKVLTQETATTVKNFFTYVECSKMCVCKEECVTVKVTDKRMKLQKHLLLSNITELHLEFKKL